MATPIWVVVFPTVWVEPQYLIPGRLNASLLLDFLGISSGGSMLGGEPSDMGDFSQFVDQVYHTFLCDLVCFLIKLESSSRGHVNLSMKHDVLSIPWKTKFP